MTFEQYYSSSMGNLYTVTAANGKRLLLECGVTWKKLQKALSYDLTNIEACLLTHEHADHSKAIGNVMAAGINVHASRGTFEALAIGYARRAKAMHRNIYYSLGPLEVAAYDANHDAEEPIFFTVRCDGEFLLFAPDASFIKQRFNIKFSIIAIECSYDIEILQHRVDTNDINETFAKRLLSSHMKKQVAMNYLAECCDLSKCREIHLLHMSADNIDKQAAKLEFEKRFFIETIIK